MHHISAEELNTTNVGAQIPRKGRVIAINTVITKTFYSFFLGSAKEGKLKNTLSGSNITKHPALHV